eukprot:gene14839-biopygen1949
MRRRNPTPPVRRAQEHAPGATQHPSPDRPLFLGDGWGQMGGVARGADHPLYQHRRARSEGEAARAADTAVAMHVSIGTRLRGRAWGGRRDDDGRASISSGRSCSPNACGGPHLCVARPRARALARCYSARRALARPEQAHLDGFESPRARGEGHCSSGTRNLPLTGGGNGLAWKKRSTARAHIVKNP